MGVDLHKKARKEVVNPNFTLKRIKQLFAVTDTIFIDDAASTVDLTIDNFLKFISSNHSKLIDFKIEGDKICVERNKSQDLPEPENWICTHCGKNNKGSDDKCVECNTPKL